MYFQEQTKSFDFAFYLDFHPNYLVRILKNNYVNNYGAQREK